MDTTCDLNLTPSQAKTLEELKRKLPGELDEEFRMFDETNLFYRFLQARDWDARKAEIMLKKCLEWRKQHLFMKDYTPTKFLREHFNNFHIGHDKEGCPVFYAPTGKYDVKGIQMSARISDIENYVYRLFAYHEKCLEKKSKEIHRRLNGFVLIFNTDGLTFANAMDKFGIEVSFRLLKMQLNNFPERLKALYFINVNSYFKISFNIVKHLLTTRTLSKMNIYGEEGWQEALLKVIDADQLPAFMGGTRTDPDGNPLCKTLVNLGGPIDESYYIHKSRNPLSLSPGANKLLISRSAFVKLPLDVEEVGSVIEWEFELDSGDINFGVSYEEMVDEQVTESVVVPLQRLSTRDFCESGIYNCEKAGKYLILFDNSHSWFWSKELWYRAKVLAPNESEEKINVK